MDDKLFEKLLESGDGLSFFGPCDRVRRTEAGENFWQQMMKNKVPVSEEEFVAAVNFEGFLDEGETWEQYRDDNMAQDPDFMLYKSGEHYFIQFAGFEMIWGRGM